MNPLYFTFLEEAIRFLKKYYTNLMDISYTPKRRSYLLCFPDVDGDCFRCCSLNAFYNTFYVSIKMKHICLLLRWFLLWFRFSLNNPSIMTTGKKVIFIQLESKISLRWNNSFSYFLQNKKSSNYLICNSYRLPLQSIEE